MKKIATLATAAVALTGASSLCAHHSISMFDISTPIWVKGTVVSYEPIAPHAMISLEERTQDGQVLRWRIEGPFPGRLNRILSLNGLESGANFVKPGDVIEVCGFDMKEEFTSQRARRTQPEAGPSWDRFAHGHVLVMPDGHMQSWGPYGKMVNCVRSHDATQSWIDFLDTDPLARGLWCAGLGYVRVATVPPQAFVDGVSSRLADTCG